MSKFCGRCGANIENTVGFCPNCGQKLNTENNSTKNEVQPNKTTKTTNKTKSPQKKKHLLAKVITIILCLVVFSGGVLCTLSYFNIVDIPVITDIVNKFSKKTPQETYATEIVNAFKDNDMSAINDIIFNQKLYFIDDNIGATFEDNKTNVSDKGALKIIFSETKISLIKVENSEFIYEIEAPEMNGVFNDVSTIQTEEELLAHIEQFVKNAKRKKTEVSVEFSENHGKYIANYKTEEFINAITGGLVEEYKNIFTQYMDEIISKE